MLRALLRYLFFTVPEYFLRGLEFILFDADEINNVYFTVQEQENKDIKERRVLLNYLEKCRRL